MHDDRYRDGDGEPSELNLQNPDRTLTMPELHPIPAIRYNTQNQRDLSTKIAPPYDVLDEGPKQELLRRDDRNIVAIDLPVTPPKTLGPDEAYNEAGQTMRQWLEEGTLKRAEKPAIYAYEQVYEVNGQTLKRRGLFGGLKAEQFNRPKGGIFRHEEVIKGGVDDRYKLTEATQAQLSPVFGMFSDPNGEVAHRLSDYFDRREPDFHGKTPDDAVEHRCWEVTDDGLIAALQQFFEKTNVYIADGHHRYTTALKYHEQHPDQPESSTALFVLVAMQDPGMIVLPYHRVLTGLSGFSMDKLKAIVDQRDDVQLQATDHGPDQLDALEASLPEAGHHAMGLYDPKAGQTYCLTSTSADPLADAAPQQPEAWRKLDVAILQNLIINELIKPNFGGDAVGYHYTAKLDDLRHFADQEAGRLGVIMQPTPLEAVKDVSLADGIMPAKSTFFYPKLATGLVVNPLA
jgi:uncharacterized protein (DUF1015 family)